MLSIISSILYFADYRVYEFVIKLSYAVAYEVLYFIYCYIIINISRSSLQSSVIFFFFSVSNIYIA